MLRFCCLLALWWPLTGIGQPKKEKDLYSKKIYAVFSGFKAPINKSNDVRMVGFKIGEISDVKSIDKNLSGIAVTMRVIDNLNIPVDSKAFIRTPLIGSSFIEIEKGNSSSLIHSGDTLATRIDTLSQNDLKNQTLPVLKNQVKLGRTTGELPYLEFGLGDDRLGGAKMGFLDTSLLIRVVDSVKDDYKIWLSERHFAYMPKSAFKIDSFAKFQPYYLSNSWRVYGDDKYDYVSVMLDERLPYRSIQQIEPSRLVVDVFGVTSNTNWITQLSTVKEIRNAWYEQIEDDVFRIFIDLNHPQHWGYHIYYEGNKLIIRIKRQPVSLDLVNLKVAVDPGHGGNNNGADGVSSKILEKNYTLLISKELQKALQKEGATVYMTREKDTSLSMIERTKMLREQEPDMLISIHLNSSNRDSIRGVSTYYRYIGFRPLTQFVLKRMTDIGLKEFGNVGAFNFSLSGPTEYPNCLVEVAFLSNKEDEKLILDPEFHKMVATQIVAGIKDWLDALRKGY